VVESLIAIIKKRAIKVNINPALYEAIIEIFDYIEIFYEPKRCLNCMRGVTPVRLEKMLLREA